MGVSKIAAAGFALAAMLAACGGEPDPPVPASGGDPASERAVAGATTPAAADALPGEPQGGAPEPTDAPGTTYVAPPGAGANPSAPALEPTPAPTVPATPAPTAEPTAPPASFTSWRVYSARIYYDEGGGGDLSNVITTQLELSDSGAWHFSSSSGAWYTAAITAEDWQRWGADPYGPTSKLVLSGWNGGTADGPVEESGGYVDFLWVIYRVEPPEVSAPGTVWMKFGAP
jgi:hypothetical protein